MLCCKCVQYFGTIEASNVYYEDGTCQLFIVLPVSGTHRNFVQGWVQQIQLRREDRENGDLGAVAH